VVLGEGDITAPEDCHRQRREVGQFLSTSAVQPFINDNSREKELLKRLQFSTILLRETIAVFNVEII